MLRFIRRAAKRRKRGSKFQYISCYGLSCNAIIKRFLGTDFNTSHVTVYQKDKCRRKRRRLISIHLMLRFIDFSTGKVKVLHKFQYISCYGLSLPGLYYKNRLHISIHLMLRFILPECPTIFLIVVISIHLMLRFISFASNINIFANIISIHLMLRFI